MDSYSGTFQWYQSSRSSAVLQKNEKEIEVETGNYPLRHHNQHRGYSEICGIDSKNYSPRVTKEEKSLEIVHEPKNIHERIDQTMTEIRRMIADMTSKKSNYSDFSSNSVSNQQSTFDRESQHLFDTKLRRNFQVPLDSGKTELHKQYKVYSSYELNEKRDRGLCIWCDEFWYIGHDCCKNKKCYVLDIDVDDAIEVNETDPIESRVDVTFVDEGVSHCETKLLEDFVENDSTVGSKCEVGNENWESSEALGKYCLVENHELHVFDKMCENNTLEDIAEKCVVYAIGSENEKLGTLEVALEYMTVLLPPKKLWLCDEGSGILMDNVVKDQLLKHVGMMFNLLSVLRGLKESWIAWPELPVPPPEPPPRFTSSLDCNKSLTSKVYKRRTIVLLLFASYSISMETKLTDFDENLIRRSIPTDSILMKKLISENENGREEMNEVQDKDHKAENVELQVFEKMPMKDTIESMIESGVNETIGCTKDQLCILDATLECLDVFTTSRALGLCDVGNGELMVVIVKNHLPRDRAELFDLMSTVESINQSCWVEWPEPPLPPPEPPPRLI